MTIELTHEMLNAYAAGASSAAGVPVDASSVGLAAVFKIIERGLETIDEAALNVAEREAYAEGYRRGRDSYLPDRPLYIAGQRADHAWQEYNEHGNSCHFPTCIFTRDEHAS